MKRLFVVLLLVTVLSLALATPALAGPPEDAGKGTWQNEGLLNAFWSLTEAGLKTGNFFASAVIDWLFYWQPMCGPPPWFVPARYK